MESCDEICIFKTIPSRVLQHLIHDKKIISTKLLSFLFHLLQNFLLYHGLEGELTMSYRQLCNTAETHSNMVVSILDPIDCTVKSSQLCSWRSFCQYDLTSFLGYYYDSVGIHISFDLVELCRWEQSHENWGSNRRWKNIPVILFLDVTIASLNLKRSGCFQGGVCVMGARR